MHHDESDDGAQEITTATSGSRLPLMLGLGGLALGVLAFGFVAANALVGGDGNEGDTAPPQGDDPTGTPRAESTRADSSATSPAKTAPGGSPTATPVPPTATAAPPTPTATVPAITSSKFFDMFRASGGDTHKSANTGLPFRRVEAAWDNSYIGCPGAGCVRGKASVWTGIGPAALGESLEATALVHNSFVAERRDANLLMDVRWSGTLSAVVGANANAGVEIEILVREMNGDTAVKTLPNMPYSVYSKDLGIEAIAGVDILEIDETRSVNIPMKLEPKKKYRIDLIITCTARAAISGSTTGCNFWGEGGGAEWTKLQVEYDTGICSPSQKGDGCIYQ